MHRILLLLVLWWLAPARLLHQLIEDLIRKLFAPPVRCWCVHLLLLLLLHLALELLLVFPLQLCFFLCLPELVPANLIHACLDQGISSHLPTCTLSPLILLHSLWSEILVIFLLLLNLVRLSSLLIYVVVSNCTDHILFLQFERLFDERTVPNWRLVCLSKVVVCSLLHLL